jgi:hypothetical protein
MVEAERGETGSGAELERTASVNGEEEEAEDAEELGRGTVRADIGTVVRAEEG